MLTKTRFANAIMRDFAEKELGQDIHNIDISKISEGDILKSSTLAVAMEYLGLLKSKSMKMYAMERGGHIFSSFNPETMDLDYISTRDLMRLLPEEIRTCKDCGEKFILTGSEETFYKRKKLELPKRCKPCREELKIEMKCAICGKEYMRRELTKTQLTSGEEGYVCESCIVESLKIAMDNFKKS